MSEQSKSSISIRIIAVLVLLIVGLLSVFVVSKVVSKPEFNASAIESLDEKKTTVMRLTATASASATALSFLPGDAGNPIANQIAELSTYFIFILGAILLEKILLSVVGYITFTIIVPIACILGILYACFNKDLFLNLAMKFIFFGFVVFITIPVSIHVSDLIYSSYQSSIEKSIDLAEQNNADIEDKKSEFAQEDKNWFEKFGDYISDVTTKIGADIKGIVKKGENSLATFIEAIATLLVVSCVIPIVVIVIFVFAIKLMISSIGLWNRGMSPRL